MYIIKKIIFLLLILLIPINGFCEVKYQGSKNIKKEKKEVKAQCDKCGKEIKRYSKIYVCDRCGARFCSSHGHSGKSCPKCSHGRLEKREAR